MVLNMSCKMILPVLDYGISFPYGLSLENQRNLVAYRYQSLFIAYLIICCCEISNLNCPLFILCILLSFFFFFWTNTLLSFLQVKSNLLQAVQFLLAFRERMNAGNPDAKAGSTTTEANLQVDPIQVSYRFSIILRILASLKWLMLLLIR